MKCALVGSDTARAIFNSIRHMGGGQQIPDGLNKIEKYVLGSRSRLFGSEVFLSFDCNDPTRSRVKIYVGRTDISLQEVRDWWTLGGRLQSADNAEGLKLVERVWRLTFPNTSSDSERQPLTMACIWELYPNNPEPAPKSYFWYQDGTDDRPRAVLKSLFEGLGWVDSIKRQRSLMETLW